MQAAYWLLSEECMQARYWLLSGGSRLYHFSLRRAHAVFWLVSVTYCLVQINFLCFNTRFGDGFVVVWSLMTLKTDGTTWFCVPVVISEGNQPLRKYG